MGRAEDYARLPPRVEPEAMVQEVAPYEAVEEIQGVRRVSPLSPVAGIDAARVHASIATSRRAEPWRRRLARAYVLYALFGFVAWVIVAQLWRLVF